MDTLVVTADYNHRRRRKVSSGHVVAQLLVESPLPTPRRSCCGRAAAEAPPATARRDASPRRGGHVPFKWEISPGVPKGGAAGSVPKSSPLLPRPPPCGGPCRARAYHHHSNTTDDTSSGDHDRDDDTFSDALDRTSSSDRLAALSARLSAIDGGGFFGSRSRRSPSFIMDRFLPAANAIATTSADKHLRRRSKSKHAKDAEAAETRTTRQVVAHMRRRALGHEQHEHSPPRRCMEAAAPKEDMEGEQMIPRACGLIFFVPWSTKPVLLGFQRSPVRSRTPRAGIASVVTASASSPPRRSITLGDALEKERKLHDWHDEKNCGSGKEWSNPGWGTALLGTSKRYCADARKALSRLTRSGTEGGGDSPRIIGRERRRSGKPIALRSASVKIPPLSPPSESWLTNARKSNAGNNKR